MNAPVPGEPAGDPDPPGMEGEAAGYPPAMPPVAAPPPLSAILNSLNHGVIVISLLRHRAGCQVRFASAPARRLLGGGAPKRVGAKSPSGDDAPAPTPALPAAVGAWLSRQGRRRRPARPEPLHCQHRGQLLRLRCLGALPTEVGGGWLVEVRAHVPPAPSCSSVELGKRLCLPARRAEVLHHLLQGHDNQTIAAAMDISLIVVKQHVQGLCRRFGASSRLAAALHAQRELQGEG